MHAMPLINHPCTLRCRPMSSMWCSRCQSAWYCTPEHLQSDWARHRKECIPATPTQAGHYNMIATPPPAEPQYVTASKTFFSPEEGASPIAAEILPPIKHPDTERSQITFISCGPSHKHSQRMCPISLVQSDFPPSYVNLTASIQHVSAVPVAFGGCSDLHTGDLVVAGASTKVCIKVLRSTERLIPLRNAESDIMGTLSHKNIVKFIGVAYYLSGRPCIVMEWYPLGNARDYLRGRSTKERLHLLSGVAEGLCYLHSRTPAIVHGDIKGTNILVNSAGEGVLCDFGCSRIIKSSDARASPSDRHINGTIRWMASELVRGGGTSLSSDVWAFGCTFYELLLGKPPYASRNSYFAVFHDVNQNRLPFVEDDGICIGSRGTWAAVRRCWDPEPKNRPTIFCLKQILTCCAYD